MAEYQHKASYVAGLRAALKGRIARRDGKDITACPYDANGSPAERMLARYWVMGWNRTRPLR